MFEVPYYIKFVTLKSWEFHDFFELQNQSDVNNIKVS